MGVKQSRSAMRTASPWWASLIYVIGLFLLFLGQRSFHGVDGIGSLATLVGALLVVGITAARVWTTMGSRGGRRRVERTLLLAHVGGGAALLLYALTTKAGMGLVGVTEAKSVARWVGSMNVLWIILLVASLIPIAMVEFTLGTASRTAFDVQSETGDDGAVEYRRVRDIAWSGLTVALAMAFLMVTCQVANDRNVRRDVSYFKTSAPGESTIAIAKSSTEKFKVLLFFPQGNEVQVEVEGYFESLAKATGKVEVEAHDRMVSAKLAGDYKVTKDGTVVIVRGDKSELLDIETDWEKARRGKSKLRTLDREVNSRLLKLVREKRKAYLTVGHGEINDYESVDPSLKGRVPERRTTALKRRLGELNYEIKDLGLIDLAQGVPEDATMVMVLAPTQPLANEELAALDRYLGKGGRLLIALDPQGQAGLGPLEGRLGVSFLSGSLTDDKVYLRQRGNASDRRWAVTTQFSAHASTTTLSRAVDKGLLLIDSGALREVPFTVDADKSKKTMVIRSMASSWLDLAGGTDFTFDDGSEKRDRYNVGAAIEGPKVPGEPDKDGKPTEKDGWRAMVFADGDLFADLAISEFGPSGPVTVIMVSGPLLDDASKWLGGEEIFVGEVTSEEDVPIKHTKNKDSAWFLMMVVGAPLLVLGIGLGYTWLRRRTRGKASRTAEVTP